MLGKSGLLSPSSSNFVVVKFSFGGGVLNFVGQKRAKFQRPGQLMADGRDWRVMTQLQ